MREREGEREKLEKETKERNQKRPKTETRGDQKKISKKDISRERT